METFFITVLAMYLVGNIVVLGLLHTLSERYKLTFIDWVGMSATSWWGVGSVLGDLINKNWED